jgi:hypothetical protein
MAKKSTKNYEAFRYSVEEDGVGIAAFDSGDDAENFARLRTKEIEHYTDIQGRESMARNNGIVDELDLFCTALDFADVEYECYDSYDEMELDDNEKAEVPFDWDAVVVIPATSIHTFFANGKLVGSAVLNFTA